MKPSKQLMILGFAVAILGMGNFSALAQREPPGCTGSGLGINLFTSLPDVHIGDLIYYSAEVRNAPFPACDAGQTNPAAAGAIQAFVVTPDGVTNAITLRRTFLAPGESDFYTNVVSYVVRAQDLRSDGTVRATATAQGDIWQNDTHSSGGGNQGVNTEVNLPCVLIGAQCVGSLGENGAIAFTGTVTNCGNNTLVGVTVTNFNDGGFFTVLFPTNLAIGQVASFSGSWVPSNPCGPSTAILTVLATDQFTATPRTVTHITTITCQNTLTAGIQVTKACPAQPVAPGHLLTFTGSVTNTGNVTLTNIVVVDNQPSPNTLVFTHPSLAPGAVATFSGSYLAPTNCSVADTLTATALSRCGVPVSSTASSTCPILTTPALVVAGACPQGPVAPGTPFIYTGSVRNVGDTALTNVVVMSDKPTANTVVFSASAMPPGAISNFTASFTAPLNACSVTTTLRGTGQDTCTGVSATNVTSSVCALTPTPLIAVTLACPSVPVETGAPITYSGIVSNAGNITLEAVTVVNSQPAPNTPVFTTPSLAPGATASFNATFTTPSNACAVSTTVMAWGASACGSGSVTNSASATCPLTTTPRLLVTRNCPETPAAPGGLLSYLGTVSNTGDIALTNIVVVNDLNGLTPVFTAALLLPGQATNFTGNYTVPSSSACAITSVLTATGQNGCSGATVTNVLSTTCPLMTTPALVVTVICPSSPATAGGPITFSGTVSNPGNVALTNVTVVNNQPAPNTVVTTIPSLAPGGSSSFVATFVTPSNTCAISTTVTAWGAGACSLISVTNQASATCALLSNARLLVTQTCPATPAPPGSPLVFGGVVSNNGDVTLTNILVFGDQTGQAAVFTIASLAPGASAPFTGSYITPVNACSVTATLTATGVSDCSGLRVTNSVTTTCPLAVTPQVAVTLVCPGTTAEPGSPITYTGTVRNPGNITLNNVTVVNNHPANGTVVLTVPSLAPGASMPFAATFTTPTNACSVTSTVVASGGNPCNSTTVTNSASATCPLGTTPRLVVTQACPATPVGPGEELIYSGSLSNAGNITLTNIVVLNDHTGPVPVFMTASLLPGGTTNFAGNFTVPATNNCSVTSTLLVTADEACSGSPLTNTLTTTCLLNGVARLHVVQNCPAVPAGSGGLLIYSGSVSNSGNVTLTNVVVVNNRPATNTVVLTVPVLAPGATAPFTGSYTVPLDCCVVWSTVTATGEAPCTGVQATDTHTTTCPVMTTPGILVTKECPPAPVAAGQMMQLSGMVTNSGDITLSNVNVVVVPNFATHPHVAATNSATGGATVTLVLVGTNKSPVVTWPVVLAPGESVRYLASYLLTADMCGGDTVTATGASACSGLVVSSAVSSSCTVTSMPAIAVLRNPCPAQPVPKGVPYTYTGTVTNTGNSTLVNVLLFSDVPSNQTPVLGPITLAPGAATNFTGTYTAPRCCCYLVDTLTVVGQDRCTLAQVYNTASSVCTLESTPGLAVLLACPSGPLTAGSTLRYSGFITNTGDVNLTNVQVVGNYPTANTTVLGPLELAPGEVKPIGGSFVAPANLAANPLVVLVTGTDTCQARLVSGQATCPSGGGTPLVLTINGNGTVSGAANGQMLIAGSSHTLTAIPGPGAAFINWSGGVSGTSTTLTFAMQPGLVVIANFTTNVYPLAGIYNGLFSNTNVVSTVEAGFFTLTLSPKGSYSVRLRNVDDTYALTGKLAPDSRATNNIKAIAPDDPALQVIWDFSRQSGVVVGTVSSSQWISSLMGERVVFNALTNPCPLAGQKFTLIFPGASSSTVSPQGDGYGMASVDANGLVTFSGVLADGTAVSQTVALGGAGDWPLYASLYGNAGAFLGWLEFVTQPGSDVAGTLAWFKNASGSARYPAGFGVTTAVVGSRYTAPTGTGTVLPTTARILVLQGGNLPVTISQPVTLGAKGKVTTGTTTLKLSFNVLKGSFTGTYKPPGSSKSFPFQGAALQKIDSASGFSLGTNQAGKVLLLPAP